MKKQRIIISIALLLMFGQVLAPTVYAATEKPEKTSLFHKLDTADWLKNKPSLLDTLRDKKADSAEKEETETTETEVELETPEETIPVGKSEESEEQNNPSKELPKELDGAISDETKETSRPSVSISKKGTIEIKKTDADTKEVITGFEFEITNDRGTFRKTIKTNSEGIGKLTELELGTYFIKEIKAPEEYETDDQIHIVDLDEQTPNFLVLLPLTSKKLSDLLPLEKRPGKINITKVDEVTQGKLFGAIFEVRDEKGRFKGHIMTNLKGIGKMKRLALGTYTLKEVHAPLGYEKNETVETITLTKEAPEAALTITNKKIESEIPTPTPEEGKGSIDVLKLDSKTKEPLFGAVLKVYDGDDQYVGQIITKRDGTGALNSLSYGTYMIQEVRAPLGYQLDSSTHFVKINEDNPKGQITLTNEAKETDKETPETLDRLGMIQLQVTDQDSQKPVVGGVYNINNPLGKTIGTVKVGLNGQGKIDHLAYGKYTIQEKSPAVGYDKDLSVYNVSLDKYDPTSTLNITTKKTTKKALNFGLGQNNSGLGGGGGLGLGSNSLLPQTGETQKRWLTIAGIILITGAITVVVKRKSSN